MLKSLLQIFSQKIVQSLKNHLFLCPYYVKKTFILTKTNCSHIIFIKLFIKNSLRSYLYLVKKTSILSKLHIMTKKVNRMSFFSDISRKKFALMPIYFQKKRPFSKKTLLHAHILSKKRPFFQKRCALMSIFSKILSKTPCGHAHIWSKTSILSKYTIIWAKKVNMMPFFSDFSRKNYRSHVKNVHSPKSTLLSSLVFVKKTAILSKTLCSYDIFSTFSWQTPCFQDLIWSKKRQYCQNNSIILAQNV